MASSKKLKVESAKIPKKSRSKKSEISNVLGNNKSKNSVKRCKTKVKFQNNSENSAVKEDIKIQDGFGEFGLDLSWTLPAIQENNSINGKHSSLMDFSGSYDLKLFCKSYVKPKPLFLAYTYFLNSEYTKYVSIGYMGEDFKTAIVLHEIGENCVVLSSFEWLSLFIYITEIDCAFNEQKMENLLKVTEDVNLKYNAVNKRIVLSKEATQVEITRHDWQIFLQLTEFFSFVLNWYNQTNALAKNYYDEYVGKCIENHLPYLDSSNYFLSKNCNKNCNFSRLFYEIGLNLNKNNTCIAEKHE